MLEKLSKGPANASADIILDDALGPLPRGPRRKANCPNLLPVPRGLLRDPRFRYSFVPAAVFGLLAQFARLDDKYRPGEGCAVAQATIAAMLNVHPSAVCRAEQKLTAARLIDADRKPVADHDTLCARLRTRDGRPAARGYVKIETQAIRTGGIKRAFLAQGIREVKGRNKHNAYRFHNDPFPITARELGAALGRCVNTTLRYLRDAHQWLIAIVAAPPGHARSTRFLSPSEIDKFAERRAAKADAARVQAAREANRLAVLSALHTAPPAAPAPPEPPAPPPLSPGADDAERALHAVRHRRPPPEPSEPPEPPAPTEQADAAEALVQMLRSRLKN